jgi:hypothetical protein
MIEKHGHIESFPPSVLGSNQDAALLFKRLATLRTDAPLFAKVDEIRWTGFTDRFPEVAEKIGDPRLVDRLKAVSAGR